MEKILQGISQLKGVNHACIYNFKTQDKGVLGTTFPALQQENIQNSTDMIEQVFSALQAIDKKHNELYFSIDNKYLAAYLMDEQHIAILLTEKRINFPLIHMGIRSASKKLHNQLHLQRQQQQQRQRQQHRPTARVAHSIKANDSNKNTDQVNKANKDESELSLVFDQLSKLLMSYHGTQANTVCQAAIQTWQETYVPNRQNLDHLITIIQQSLPNDTDRQNFTLIAKNLYR
ncbi:MAG TPA: hypothetical protein ENK78_03995 [Thiothrix sp.]|nr:hypothetical protein [Thiothrix sp.]